MVLLRGVIILFILIESLNVLTLYFKPDAKVGNGLGVFKAYEKSKDYPEIHDLINYLIAWVAGTKLIFIVLLLVIVITGSSLTQWLAVCGLILSILSFYLRLYPMIRKADQGDLIEPKGYSKTLGLMIGVFIIVFLVASLLTLPSIL